MSDTFPDETLYPVLTSIADDDRIFASNSAAGHESSQIKGSAIKDLVTGALAQKAPLASPALTGTPTAPTAAAGTNTTQIATTAFVAGSLAAKAPLASPALTGTPTAPTAAAGTNTTQLATTAFVTGSVALKAPLASPALTGTPTAPTAAAGTNTTQLATTAFVRNAKTMTLTNFLSQVNISAVANNIYGLLTTASGSEITLPTGANYTYQIGEEIVVIVGNNGLTVATIKSGDYIIKAGGLHPKNTPINLSLSGTTIVFRRVSQNAWSMLYPEYELSLKAPLASPALTGTPTAPTAAAGTNTTQLANCAFVQAALAGASGVPAGVICMWSGTIATVPSGWALCDGANGTPDLVDRFVVAAGSKAGGDKYNPGDTGGLDSVTLALTQIPAHTHAGTTAGGGAHGHDVYYWDGVSTGSGPMIDKRDNVNNNWDALSSPVSPVSDHTHAFTTDSKGGGGSHENRPPYYALAYIMKL